VVSQPVPQRPDAGRTDNVALQARAARDAGARLFHIALPSSETTGFAVPMGTTYTRTTSKEHATLLDAIEAQGWHLDHAATYTESPEVSAATSSSPVANAKRHRARLSVCTCSAALSNPSGLNELFKVLKPSLPVPKALVAPMRLLRITQPFDNLEGGARQWSIRRERRNIHIAVEALFEVLAGKRLPKAEASTILEGLVQQLTSASRGCRFEAEWDKDTPWSRTDCAKHGG
jgi:hypothetical protein